MCAFGALGARRVSAWCRADDRASVRVMQQAGMRPERRYGRTVLKSGRPAPCPEYAVRIGEWRAGGGSPGDGPPAIAGREDALGPGR